MQRLRMRWMVAMLGFLCLPGNGAEETPKPPVARKQPHTTLLHGETLVDDYYWLREKTNRDVIAYLEAENAYTDAIVKPTAKLQDTLYREMVGRIKETDLTVPYRKGDYFYYSRTAKGKQYATHCRKRGSLRAKESVTLDLNALAQGEKFLGLGVYQVSDDANLLAYSLDTSGFRVYTLHVKDLRTGKTLPDRIEKVDSAAWAADNRTLFYVTEDDAKRPYRLWRHALGLTKDDELLYEEKDERFRVGVSRSRSKQFIFVNVSSHTADEVRYVPADQPNVPMKLIAAREKDHEYRVDHGGDVFYITTNLRGRNFSVMTAPVDRPGKESWKELIPHRDDVMIGGVSVFAKHVVISEREGALPHLRVLDRQTNKSYRIEMREQVYAVGGAENPEFDTTTFRFSYQSLTTPPSVYDYDVVTNQRKLLKRTEVRGGYDPEKYQSERIFAIAGDGTRVPISLVFRKGLARTGQNPLLLSGYGSYGAPSFVGFNSNRLSLLDRGFVFALAHIRGGGDLGKKWHDDGRMLQKKNTFTDFIACAEHLIAAGYTARERLAIEGGSAGGLLMGTVTNLRPDLFKVVVSHVPFVDVINTMLDESLPLTVGEFEEWGNPKVKAEYDYMKTYSPYDNLERKAYPTMLVKTSLNDSQVMYWEPAKYVAKLRAIRTDHNPLVFKVNMAAGHGGSSGRYDRLREIAFDYAFMLIQLGIQK